MSKSDLIKDYPEEALLEEVRRAAGLVEGPVLTKADFTKHTGISADALARRFGRWGTVLERAGLSHMLATWEDSLGHFQRKVYSDEYLLEEIRRVAGIVGRPVLTMTDFDRRSKVSGQIAAKRFGGWPAALERAGLSHMRIQRAGQHYADDLVKDHSDEALLEDARRAAGLVEGPMLTKADFTKHTGICAGALARRFGGWGVALERAGLSHMLVSSEDSQLHRPKYTDEYLLEEIRRVAGIVGKPAISQEDFTKHAPLSCSTVIRRFGDWRRATQRAGVGCICHRRSTHTDEECLEEIRRVADTVGKPGLTMTDFDRYSKISSQVTKRRFGDWSAALGRAGLGPARRRRPGRHNSDEDLVTEVRRVDELVGKPFFSTCDFDAHSTITSDTCCRRFGNWRKTLERAGLGHKYANSKAAMSYNRPRRYSDDQLVEELRRVAQLLGKPTLTRSDFDRNSKMCSASVYTRFGGWRNALERAGLGGMYSHTVLGGYTAVGGRSFPEEALLDEVRRVSKIVGMPALIQDDFNAHSKICVHILLKRFGSWQATLERAGLGHLYYGSHKKHPDEYLLALLRRVAGLLGKPVLTEDDFASHSGTKAETVSRRFGSWRAALEQAGLIRPNKEQP